jgi:di/tricarboxylate transporter
MTLEILLIFAILAAAIVLFITEIVRVDLVGLGVLVVLALTGLVQTDQALSGFSNPAVVTIWAMFILSAALSRTGVSSLIGRQVLRFASGGEGRLIAVLMSVTGLLSAFMNNIGVAAMFLPITMEIARRTKRPASQLLLPMAYGALLGGLVLLIGTASNLLVRDALREAGFTPFGLFDFAPGGLLILAVCVAYMALIGRRWLPVRETPRPLSAGSASNGRDLRSVYGLEERLAYLILPDDSPLAGKTLSESRINRALGLNVLSIRRKNGQRVHPGATVQLAGGDRLLILGRLDMIEEIAARPLVSLETDLPQLSNMLFEQVGLAEFAIAENSPFTGKTLARLNMRAQYGVNILAIRRGEQVYYTDLQDITLRAGDYVLLQGPLLRLDAFTDELSFRQLSIEDLRDYEMDGSLLFVRIPGQSPLIGRTLKESRLGAAYSLSAVSVRHEGADWQMPRPDLALQEGDLLIVEGRPQDIEAVKGLSALRIDRNVNVDMEDLESGPQQFVEVMLSPFTTLTGKTLKELKFREKYGVSVIALWRGDRSYRTSLGDITLSYGDALLCYGPRARFELMARDRDFVVLNLDVQEPPRLEKAPYAALIMLAVVASVMFLGLPISIAAIAGSVLMVLTRCISMEEAYQSIEWRAVFLIAAMLPLGLAMQQTGAAAYVGQLVIQALGGFGPTAILAGLMVLSMLATQFMPSVVVAVIMSPLAISTAVAMGASPYPYMMGVAYSLAASVLSPLGHPANVLVMSPGGYRYSDYFKQGLPIAVIVLVLSVLLLPRLFPY